MGIIDYDIPIIGEDDEEEEPKIPDALTKILALVNGNINGDNLADDAIGAEHIEDLAIATAHVQDNAVTMDKLATGASDREGQSSTVNLTLADTWYNIITLEVAETGRYHVYGNIVINNSNASNAVIECQARELVNISGGAVIYQDKRYIGATTGLQWSIKPNEYIDLTSGDIYTLQAKVIGAISSTAPANQSYFGIERIA
jgi:hypothetical protein